MWLYRCAPTNEPITPQSTIHTQSDKSCLHNGARHIKYAPQQNRNIDKRAVIIPFNALFSFAPAHTTSAPMKTLRHIVPQRNILTGISEFAKLRDTVAPADRKMMNKSSVKIVPLSIPFIFYAPLLFV